MALYLRNYLLHHLKIDMILCVDYMLMANVNKIQLVQQILMVVGLYKKIQIYFLLFLFVLTLTSLTLWLTHCTRTLHGVVWLINIRQKVMFQNNPKEVKNPTPEDFNKKFKLCWLILAVYYSLIKQTIPNLQSKKRNNRIRYKENWK